MIPELEKPRITEIQVRMDCNGCVQKIKKALHGINGIYELYVDFPQQKLTIIGRADPEKIVKAIKKTRKTATICSHSESSAQPTEPPPAQPTEQAPLPDATNPPPAEAPPAEAAPPADPPKDPPPPENAPPDGTPPTAANDNSAGQPAQPSGPKDVEEVHVIYHHPPDYGYRYGYGHSYGPSYGGQWNNYPNGPKFQQEPGFQQEPSPPVYVTHSYNTYNPSPNVTHSYNTYRPSPYVTEYEYIRSPPRSTNYGRPERYSDGNANANANITSMFSDENPNACRIV